RLAEQAADRLARLEQLTASLAAALTPTEVGAMMVEEAMIALGASSGVLALVTPDGRSLEVARRIGIAAETLFAPDRGPLDGSSLLAEAACSRGPIVVHSPDEIAARYPTMAAANGTAIQAMAAAPIAAEGRPLAAIGVGFDRPQTFGPERMAFLRAISRQGALALERALLYQAEREARSSAETNRQRLEFLADASAVLGSSLDYETTLRQVLASLTPEIADWAMLHITQPDGALALLDIAHGDLATTSLAADITERFRNGGALARLAVPRDGKTGGRLWALLAGDDLERLEPDPDRLRLLRAAGVCSVIAVPLTVRGQRLGVLTLARTDAAPLFGEADLVFARDLAQRAAGAVANARHYLAEETARREAEAATARTARLQAATAALSEALTPDDVAGVVVEQGIGALGAQAGAIVLPTTDGAFRVARAIGYSPQTAADWSARAPRAPAPLTDAIRLRRPVLAPDETSWCAQYPHLADVAERSPHRAFAAMPLLIEGRAIGAIGLSFAEPRQFDDADVEMMLALARQSAQALERARLFQAEREARTLAEAAEAAARRDAARIATLADLSRAVVEVGPDLEAATEAVSRIAATHLRACCVVRLLSEDGAWIDVAALHHPELPRCTAYRQLVTSYRQPAGEGFSGSVLTSGRPLLLPDVAAAVDAFPAPPNDYWLRMADGDVGGLLAVALRARGRRIGTLTLLRGRADAAFREDEIAFVQELADRAALAIDNALLFREARDALRDRDEFLLAAAHELRTPVTTVKGYAQMLQRAYQHSGSGGDKSVQFLVAIDEATDRLRLLADDLLDVSRLRLGDLPLRLGDLDLATLARKVVEHRAPQLGERHPLLLTLGRGPVAVWADADRVDQILINMIDNAAKYSPDGGLIQVSVEPDGDGVLLSVADQGMGLPLDELESIFEPFRRAANAVRDNLPGLGLGLAICRSVAERHGGRIWAESAGEGHGTTVRLWLPTGEARTDAEPADPERASMMQRAAEPTLQEVELFGPPRLLAGQASIAVSGETLGDLARDLAARCPALAGPVLDPITGWPRHGYVFVVEERFTRDPATVLSPGAAVLLVSMAAGG
ncbi:MAG: GAF domain-containing protein, partial [Thermomicrobiales bacterium]|nr:GAF domain-containing protein [Thermomicrobiales bacterium]